VRSLVLVQGTLSAFAFCARDPAGPGRPGRYHRALDPAAVTGPVVVTRSGHDRVTGWLHPLAAQSGADDGPARTAQSGAASGSGSDGGPVLGGLPRNAALGTLGARGLGGRSVDLDARPAGAGYRFEPGRVYNLDATRVLGPGEAIAAAHCDVTRPELAHAAWQAALAASPRPGPPPAPARRARVAAAGPAT
jgi:hypothetical protein